MPRITTDFDDETDWYPPLPHKTWLSLAPDSSTLISTRRLGDPLLTLTRTTSLSQPWSAHVYAHTTTLANQCSADLMSRTCIHKRLPNLFPFAFRNSFTMLLNTLWQHLAHTLHTAAEEKIRYHGQKKSTWFDDECRQAAIEKNDAFQATLKWCCLQEVPREEERRTPLVSQKEA